MPFIVIDGPDNVGKSTQVALLQQRLRTVDIGAITTREPGAPLIPLCQQIREVLRPANHHDTTALGLFLADRAAHMDHIKGKFLDHGWWVICDRWEHSTLAYQGGPSRAEQTILLPIVRHFRLGIMPGLTILLFRSEPLVGTADAWDRKWPYHELCQAYRIAASVSDVQPTVQITCDGAAGEVADIIWEQVKGLVDKKIQEGIA